MNASKLHISLPAAYRAKVEDLAAAAGLPVCDYVSGILIQHALSGATPGVKKPMGRPVTVTADDLPPDLEQAPTNSGYAGVTKRGRLWQAKVRSEAIGQFSSAALAAIARHFLLIGFKVGRGELLRATGMDPGMAAELGARAQYAPMPVASPLTTKLLQLDKPEDEPENDDPSEEVNPEGPRETSGEGVPEPSTSVGSLAQSKPRFKLFEPICTGCRGAIPPNSTKGICAKCEPLYQQWLQDDDEPLPPADGVYVTNAKGGRAPETFNEYVTRIRG